MVTSNYQTLHSQGKCSISFLLPRYSGKKIETERFNAELLLFAEINKLVRDGRKYFLESQGWRSGALGEVQNDSDYEVQSDSDYEVWTLEYRIILAEPNKAEIGDIVYLSVRGEEYRLRDRLFKRRGENVWLRVS